MGITNTNKELSASKIKCNEKFNVKLSLTATPDILKKPKDIVLVLDRSGSMYGQSIIDLQNSAKEFVDIIDKASDDKLDGIIGNGSHIGVVSFATDAKIDVPLTTNANEIKDSIELLTVSGVTNHADAFEKAKATFDMTSPNEKILVMLTDGATTAGDEPGPIAQSIKDDGITIYCIGLGVKDPNSRLALRLNEWSSDPDSTHVLLVPNSQELEETFKRLAYNINAPGATNIEIKDTINPCFKINSFNMPNVGNVKLIDGQNIEWKIEELGVTSTESAVLQFEVEHIGPCSGLVEVNENLVYMDSEENIVNFHSPKIDVVCGTEVVAENCPEVKEITIDSCEDYAVFDAGDILLNSLGRVLEVNAKLKNVCPDKKVALAAYLTETDIEGNEYNRGVKVFTIPAHRNTECQDVLVKCIKFVLPEEEDMQGSTNSLCDTRNFKVRFLANYIDTDVKFDCCNQT